MLTSPEPVILTTRPIGGLGDKGRLKVELPHWSAFLELQDQDSRLLDDTALDASDDDEAAAAVLTPGAYQVTVRLDGRVQMLWASVLAGRESTVPRGAWQELTAAGPSPAPPGTGSTRRAEASLRASLGEARPVRLGGDAQLFVFIESSNDEARRLMSRLELVLPGGESLRLRALQTSASSRGQWSIAHVSAPAGGYLLRDPGLTDRGGRSQPVHLPRDWQAQVVLPGDHEEPLAALRYSLARPEVGFDPREEERVLANAILAEIGGNGLAGVMRSNPMIVTGLKAGFKNPWLGVLVAYALLDPSAQDASALEAGQTLLRSLQGSIGDHPDVRALDPGNGPVDGCAPMLREGLRRTLQTFSTTTGAPPPAWTRDLLVDSPWTAWRDAAASLPTEEEAALQVAQTVLPSSAPIFPISEAPRDQSARDLTLMQAGYDALLTVIAAKDGPSSMADVGGRKAASPHPAPLRWSTSVADLITASAAPREGPTLDDEAGDLLGWAEELSSSAVDPTGTLADRVKNLAFGLLDLADLVVVTDDTDQPLYANGAVKSLSLEYGSRSLFNQDGRFLVNPEGLEFDGRWSRTTVDDERGLVGYVHTLESDSQPMPEASRDELRGALHRLSLQAGLAIHGTDDRRDDYLAKIADLVSRCETLVSDVPKRL